MRGLPRAARVPGVAAVAAPLLLAWVAGAFVLGGCIPTAKNLAAGAEALPCTGPSCVPLDGGAPITTAPLVNCASAEQGVEFAPFTVLDSENAHLNPANSNPPAPGAAEYFYQYVDGTAGLTPAGYSPPAIKADRCIEATPGSNYVLHTSGGPFTGWGGGIGIGLYHLNVDANLCGGTQAPVCPPAGGATTPETPCYCPNALDPGAEAIDAAALDVSQWDGISLWARRGPNSQPLMRVLVGDKYTDDDISYLMAKNTPTQPRYCERKADCSCNYQDTSCAFYSGNKTDDPDYYRLVSGDTNNPDPSFPTDMSSNGALYCGPPGSHPASASQNSQSTSSTTCLNATQNQGTCADNFCGNSICDQPYPAFPGDLFDPLFINRACTPYTYRNGTLGNVCYNPATDPLPPEADEQCGDHFTFPINLSTEWQFYKIPFAQMFQQGWAKQAPTFDLRSVSVVRFTWDVGYIDYYIDDVRFYRVARGGDATVP